MTTDLEGAPREHVALVDEAAELLLRADEGDTDGLDEVDLVAGASHGTSG